MSRSHTSLPATTRRGVLASAQSVKVKILPGALVGARQVKRVPTLSAYRLPTFVKRPPFAVLPRA